jgi:hypothetical protein
MRVYLIDEKKLRQENYGWNNARFSTYSDLLVPIYDKSSLDIIKVDAFADSQNIILFHDSFFDVPKNKPSRSIDLIRQDILERNRNMPVVLFSGGTTNRFMSSKFSASIPVDVLYKNLELFIQKAKNGQAEIKYLVYGLNYDYERIAQLRMNMWETIYRMGEYESLPLSERFEENLIELLGLIGEEGLFEKLKALQTGYFKCQINELIKMHLYV